MNIKRDSSLDFLEQTGKTMKADGNAITKFWIEIWYFFKMTKPVQNEAKNDKLKNRLIKMTIKINQLHKNMHQYLSSLVKSTEYPVRNKIVPFFKQYSLFCTLYQTPFQIAYQRF